MLNTGKEILAFPGGSVKLVRLGFLSREWSMSLEAEKAFLFTLGVPILLIGGYDYYNLHSLEVVLYSLLRPNNLPDTNKIDIGAIRSELSDLNSLLYLEVALAHSSRTIKSIKEMEAGLSSLAKKLMASRKKDLKVAPVRKRNNRRKASHA